MKKASSVLLDLIYISYKSSVSTLQPGAITKSSSINTTLIITHVNRTMKIIEPAPSRQQTLDGPSTLLVPEEEIATRREKPTNPPSRVASPPQPTPTPCTFHPFPRLPAELRLTIYELVFRGDLQPKIHFLSDRHGWRHNTEVELVSHLRASDEKHYSRIGYACREARAFWLFRTELVWAFGTWVNWSRDGFWIDDRMGVKEVGVSLRSGDGGIGMDVQGDGSHAASTGSEEEQDQEIFLTPNAYAHILSQPGISQIQNLILRRRILLNNPLPGNFLMAWGKVRGCLPRMKELWVVMNEDRGVEEIKREGELRFRALKARERRAWRDVAYVRAFVQALRGGVELSRGGRKENGQCEHGMVFDDSEKVKVDFMLVGTKENGGEDGEIEFVRRIRYPGGRVF
jgi:hypothetical protein